MLLRKTLVTSCVCLFVASQANAGIEMFADSYVLAPDTAGQVIDIMISSMAGDPKIVGANFNAQIPSGPVFDGPGGLLDAAQFSPGTIWTPSHHVSGFAPPTGFPEFVTVSVTLDDLNQSVDASGVIARLVVDTTGLFSGTYDLLLKNDSSPFVFASNVVLEGGVELEPTLTNGTITINAVPEPSPLLLLSVAGCLGGVCVFIRRWRSAVGTNDSTS
ncbi:MAG: PEP-CTERM sorting domain-containing protein [Planctomycetales bacterium]|nr:PEP-CTERM sorting domain-containing protein [Planctomycetales bacterium]